MITWAINYYLFISNIIFLTLHAGFWWRFSSQKSAEELLTSALLSLARADIWFCNRHSGIQCLPRLAPVCSLNTVPLPRFSCKFRATGLFCLLLSLGGARDGAAHAFFMAEDAGLSLIFSAESCLYHSISDQSWALVPEILGKKILRKSATREFLLFGKLKSALKQGGVMRWPQPAWGLRLLSWPALVCFLLCVSKDPGSGGKFFYKLACHYVWTFLGE